MNYATIKYNDIANGKGIRTSLFVSGCTHRCKGCFNSEAWDFSYGQPFTKEIEDKILDIISSDIYITAKKISEQLLISQRQVERVISDLKLRGVIERVGARKNGYWKIIK